MFWWLYYTTADVANYTERPLAIWLQGGPGASSSGYGNFEELGPLDLYLNERNFSWVREMNVLFIDNPVGAGFSYVDDYSYLTTDNSQIASDLLELLRGFYNHAPEFKTVPLHIFSESYGGKMAAEFAWVLDKEIKDDKIECDLQSVTLIDAWMSPIDSVLSWAPFLKSFGFVDVHGHDVIHKAALQTKDALDRGQFAQATDLWGYTEMVIWDETHGIDFYVINSLLDCVKDKNFDFFFCIFLQNVLVPIQFQQTQARFKALDKKSIVLKNGSTEILIYYFPFLRGCLRNFCQF
jgi:serine carboxypeptidase 1